MIELIILLIGLAVGVVVCLLLARLFGKQAPVRHMSSGVVVERVRSAGRLVALEARAKEISTSRKGWSWMPSALLSQARVAMIYHFEKQYSVDLGAIHQDDLIELGDGRFRLRLPDVEGRLLIRDIQPYDIQSGRILGLVDVIPVDADTQRELMDAAREEAASAFESEEGRYIVEARASAERQLASMLGMFGVLIEIEWVAGCEIGTAQEKRPAVHGALGGLHRISERVALAVG
jgi:hypothetical protein